MRIYTFIFTFILTLSPQYLFAQQEFFPFLAEITSERVNVRAGQSANFERLCQLNEGEEVVVLEHVYSWYKIKLPAKAKSFINAQYVKPLGNDLGEVTAKRINIRAGSSTKHTVVGKVNQGDIVIIQESLDEWIKIQPLADSTGWIAEQFLAFKSKDVGAYKEKRVELTKSSQEQVSTPIKEKIKIEQPAQKVVSISGRLKSDIDNVTGKVRYIIAINQQPVYYVKGPSFIFRDFLNYDVAVEGTIDTDVDATFSYPGILVSKIKLML